MSKTKTNALHRVPPYRRPIIIIGFVIMVSVVALIVFAIISSQKPSQDASTSTNESSDSTPSPQSPAENLPDQPSELPSEPERPAQYEGQDPNTLSELTGRIAYRSVNPDTGVLTVMVGIDQYLSADGECTLRLQDDEQELYSMTVPATADITTSVCGPFEVPISDFASGTYQTIITISADGKTGTITDDVQF